MTLLDLPRPRRDLRRAQSSKTRRESTQKPLIHDLPGVVASLSRARSLPPVRGSRREAIASPETSPKNTEPRWQKHASRLQKLLAETDCELVAENTFISVSPNCCSAGARSRSMPAQVDDYCDRPRSGTATPEPWEREDTQEQSSVGPFGQEGQGIPLQAVHCVQFAPSDSPDLIRWLMEHAMSHLAGHSSHLAWSTPSFESLHTKTARHIMAGSAARIAALEERASVAARCNQRSRPPGVPQGSCAWSHKFRSFSNNARTHVSHAC
ncbi:unnamed protein product [Durusdinium trenchii]|uniref:Uncharacterized protein n=1 Tax=Durusdinium trenchii TaxID=1381693 RepID=A0ABP0QLU7_9DINO